MRRLYWSICCYLMTPCGREIRIWKNLNGFVWLSEYPHFPSVHHRWAHIGLTSQTYKSFFFNIRKFFELRRSRWYTAHLVIVWFREVIQLWNFQTVVSECTYFERCGGIVEALGTIVAHEVNVAVYNKCLSFLYSKPHLLTSRAEKENLTIWWIKGVRMCKTKLRYRESNPGLRGTWSLRLWEREMLATTPYRTLIRWK